MITRFDLCVSVQMPPPLWASIVVNQNIIIVAICDIHQILQAFVLTQVEYHAQ